MTLTQADYSFKYIIIHEAAIRPFYEDGLSGDWNMFCRAEYTLMGLVCVKISSSLLETLRPSLGRSFEEVPAIEAIHGIQFFSEIRDEISIFEESPEIHWTWAMEDESSSLGESTSPPPSGTKVKRAMTSDEIANTVSFMYKFGKEIIDQQDSLRMSTENYRFLRLKKDEIERRMESFQRLKESKTLQLKQDEEKKNLVKAKEIQRSMEDEAQIKMNKKLAFNFNRSYSRNSLSVTRPEGIFRSLSTTGNHPPQVMNHTLQFQVPPQRQYYVQYPHAQTISHVPGTPFIYPQMTQFPPQQQQTPQHSFRQY